MEVQIYTNKLISNYNNKKKNMPKTRRQQKRQEQQENQIEKAEKKQQHAQVDEKRKEVHQRSQSQSKSPEDQQVQKKGKNPKKYKKKTFQQLKRINKSKNQRIFLLSAQRNNDDDTWRFLVQGTKGSKYNVNLSTEVRCGCMDFRLKQSPCKHIYFIVTQVGQNDQLLDYFKSDKKISKKAFKILDQQLSTRLKARMSKAAKDPKQIDLKDDTDCVICFTEMQKQTEPLQDCSTCKKYFHTQCISAWKNHNPSCPLCRGPLAGGNDKDPLGLLIDIKI